MMKCVPIDKPAALQGCGKGDIHNEKRSLRSSQKKKLMLLVAAVLLLALLSGCSKVCSFCGRPAVFYDQCRIHGQKIVVCPFCQAW